MSDYVRWRIDFTVKRPGKTDVTNGIIVMVEEQGEPLEWERHVGPNIARLIREADYRTQQAKEDEVRVLRELADTLEAMKV